MILEMRPNYGGNMKKTYYLSHVTIEENLNIIKKENKFLKSVHNKNIKNWLGEGIYFWEANDKDAITMWKNKIKRKNKKAKVMCITVPVKVNDKNYAKFEESIWQEKLITFLKSSPVGCDVLSKIISIYQKQESLTQEERDEYGQLFGDSVDAFVEYCIDEGLSIDLVSYNFYHSSKDELLAGLDKVYHKQFCVKNDKLVNTVNLKKCMIENI